MTKVLNKGYGPAKGKLLNNPFFYKEYSNLIIPKITFLAYAFRVRNFCLNLAVWPARSYPRNLLPFFLQQFRSIS
ncbi:MAG: hypothetical protein BGO39_30460 [Chloroflexi bacterium 54-19]|nr:MAG: hypothetical protein BGO39_30460 [Chloroflexi bacterium 54-19]